jgi:hypothetical protein
VAWTCENCRYFEPGGKAKDGECRRRPPTVLSGPETRENRAAVVYSPAEACWPPVARSDWCGEWVQRDERYVGGH